MRRLAILILASLLLLSACSKAKDEDIIIGFSGTLTGPLSDLGVSGRNGAMLAIDLINEKGGVNGRLLRLEVRDDQNDPRIAVQVNNELHSLGANIIVGNFTSSLARETIDAANRNGYLLFSPTIASNEYTAIEDNFFRLHPSNKQSAFDLATYAYHLEGHKEAMVIFDIDNSSYTESLGAFFAEKFIELGGNVLDVIGFSNKSLDFSYYKLATEIIKYQPEMIACMANAHNSGMIAQQLKRLGYSGGFYVPAWSFTEEYITIGGRSVEGSIVFSNYLYDSDNERAVEFREMYFSRFGVEPSFSSGFSYETVMVIYEALLKAGRYDVESFKTAIVDIGEFIGLTGSFTIDRFGDSFRESFIYRVVNGRFERVN